MIKYIKKKKEKGMEILIDSYRGIITSVVRNNCIVHIVYNIKQFFPMFKAVKQQEKYKYK